MNAFDVWVRPLGKSCRVRVSGTTNAEWLLKRLGESFAVDNADPCREKQESDICTFEVPCKLPRSRNRLEKALASMPEVRLRMRPE